MNPIRNILRNGFFMILDGFSDVFDYSWWFFWMFLIILDGFWMVLIIFDGFLDVFDYSWWFFWMFLIILDGFWMVLIIFDGFLDVFDHYWWCFMIQKNLGFRTEVCQKDQCPGHRRAQICWRCPEIYKTHRLPNAKRFLMWVFPKIGVPQNGWFIRENPIKMDDLGVSLFLETPMYHHTYAIASMGRLYIYLHESLMFVVNGGK